MLRYSEVFRTVMLPPGVACTELQIPNTVGIPTGIYYGTGTIFKNKSTTSTYHHTAVPFIVYYRSTTIKG
eukprot:COSAG02_NODE_1818_length_10774_cov_4.788009_3_plen_70_part_00